MKHATTASPLSPEPIKALQDPEQTQNAKRQRAPMDERVPLVLEDGKEGPTDCDRCCDVTLWSGECVSGSGGFKEEETEEDEDLCPDTWGFGKFVDAESFEGSYYYEDGSETVVEREGEMNPEFIVDVLPGVVLPHDVVDMRNSARDEECENESDNVMLSAPYVYVNGREDGKKRESP